MSEAAAICGIEKTLSRSDYLPLYRSNIDAETQNPLALRNLRNLREISHLLTSPSIFITKPRSTKPYNHTTIQQ